MNQQYEEKLFSTRYQFETDQVLLRPLLPEDIDGYRKIAFDEKIWKFYPSMISNETELQQFVTDAIRGRETRTRVTFTSIHKPTGEIAGSSSYGNISFRDQRLEIGWTWTGTAFQRTGINRANKFLLLQFAFEVLQFVRVEFKTDVLNEQARKALLAIGCTEEGILRSHTLMNHGRRRDTIYYSILRNEWPAIRQGVFGSYHSNIESSSTLFK